MLANGSTHTCIRMNGCPTGGGNLDLSSAPRMSTLVMSKSQGWPTGKLQPSGCQLHSWKKIAGGPLHPAWVCWGKRTIFPQRTSKDQGLQSDVMKWWCWPWPFRDVLSNLECHEGCSAEQYKSSTHALPLYLREVI